LKKLKTSALGLILAGVAVAVTSCNPPLPPELQAQLADNSINCGSAPISISASVGLSTFLESSIYGYSELCPSAGSSTFSPDVNLPADVVITPTSTAPTTCDSFLTVPMMSGAATIVTSLQGLDGMILDPKTLAQILNGEITTWSDPKIASLNPQFTQINFPIVLDKKISAADAAAIDAWLSRVAPDSWTGWPATFDISGDEFDPNNMPPELSQDGGLGFVPFWYVSQFSLQTVQLKLDPNQDAVPSAGDNIASAASQLVLDSDTNPFTAKLDSTREPLPIPGYDVALAPWQALVPYYAHACKGSASEQDSRSFLRYLLRNSSQSSLPDSGYFAIPIEMRGKVLESVSQGLPSPSPLASETAVTP
jgi:hypothetical protein